MAGVSTKSSGGPDVTLFWPYLIYYEFDLLCLVCSMSRGLPVCCQLYEIVSMYLASSGEDLVPS